jgi:hypothetical protein
MARIFSIHFMHEGVVHNAMVSVRTTPFFSEFTITMLDEEIAGLLPNNKILSATKNHFVFSDSSSENSPQLMNAIIGAVAEHMQTMHA